MWGGSNLAFSFDLMSKFLVDMEALVGTRPLQMEQVERLLRFLKYTTVHDISFGLLTMFQLLYGSCSWGGWEVLCSRNCE